MSPETEELLDGLLGATGDQMVAALLFGSQLAGTTPGAHSAHDLVLVVDAYRPFYRALREAEPGFRPAWLLSALARVLPPNVIAYLPRGAHGPVAKCMVLSRAHFTRALSDRAADHFIKGRMAQRVAVIHARDETERARTEELLARAREDVLRWVGPWLDRPFSVGELTLRMLEVSYAGELRPESGDRVQEVHDAQADYLAEVYGEVLLKAEEAGRVERVEGGWRLLPRRDRPGKARLRLYFLRSKLRATLRWLKHVLTFNDWLPYIQKKVERRTGMTVEITPLERKAPLIFLWPKVFKVLLNRPGSAPPRDDAP